MLIPHPILKLFFCWVIFLVTIGVAQDIQLIAPENKEVSPGEYVTLMFRLEAPAGSSFEALATSKLGWAILRQPGTLEVNDKTKLIPVTVEIPLDAIAGSVEMISLSVASRIARVDLTVKEQRGLELQAPGNVVLGKEDIKALLRNTGNVEDVVNLELSYGGEVLENRELTLKPQAQTEQRFDIQDEGLYILTLNNQQEQITRAVTVIRFGVPKPEPLGLLGQWQGSLDMDLEWQSSLSLGGSLSDFWVLDGVIDIPSAQRSYLELASENWGVRLGVGQRRSFGVSLLPLIGLSVRNSNEGASILSSLGWLREDQYGFYILEAFESEATQIALGTGISAGELVGVARYRFREEKSHVDIELEYVDRALDLSLKSTTFEAPGELEIDLEALQLGKDVASAQFRISYSVDSLLMYTAISTPIAEKGESGWTVGLSTPILASVPGALNVGIQWGNFGGDVGLRYLHDLGSGWQGAYEVGWLTDQKGGAWSLDAYWGIVQDIYFRAGGQLLWYQQAPLEAFLEADINFPFGEGIEAFGEARWDIDDQTLGLNTGMVWRENDWDVQVSTNLSYDYGTSFQPLAFDVRLSAAYTFELPVPENVTQDFAGRNTGLITGRVQGGGQPVANVVLEVDRYNLVTDAEGRFEAELPPGEYTLKLDKRTLPITYRLTTPEEIKLSLPLQRELQINFDAIATAAISGRVLLDADGDGKADEPAKPAEAQFVLEDSEGFRRLAKTNQEGSFLIQGLLPGKAILKVAGLSFGSRVVGSDQQTLTLTAGNITEVVWVVQPPTTLSQDFSEVDLRIRRISTEVDQAPPGTAPRVTVTIQGEPDSVVLQTATETIKTLYNDKAWEGRLPIPPSAPPGVYPFTVIAKQGQGEVSKKAQIIVDSSASAFEIDLSSPVKPGDTLSLELLTYFEADGFEIIDELGLPFELVGSNGVYKAEVLIPPGTPDKIYPLSLEVVSSSGVSFMQAATYRVLVTE